jgi:hypothetical protein
VALSAAAIVRKSEIPRSDGFIVSPIGIPDFDYNSKPMLHN